MIAHLSSGGKLAMEIKIERGCGYVPGNVRNLGDSKSIGKLVLDASFSPVRRVAYNVKALVSNNAPTSTS